MNIKGRKYISVFINLAVFYSSLSIVSPAHSKPKYTSVKCTQSGAFRVSSLGSIEVPSSCKGGVNIPYGVKFVTVKSFDAATQVTSISIPSSVKRIDAGSFADATKLVSIKVADPRFFQAVSGVLYDKDQSTLIAYPVSRKGSSFDVPKSVKVIGAEAFKGSKALKRIQFHSGGALTIIGERAFAESSLTSIRIPVRVTSIGNGAFSKSKSLANVSFTIKNSKLSNIGADAFSHTSITRIVIPSSVITMGDRAFFGTNKMNSVSLRSNRLDAIGESAFAGNRLRVLTIPASVTSISKNAFSDNDLINVIFKGNSPNTPSAIFNGNPKLPSIRVSNSSTGWSSDFFGLPVIRNP
jgi:hypothetical protein